MVCKTATWIAVCSLVFIFTSGILPAQTPAEFERMRNALVDTVLIPAGIKDPRVIQSLRITPRHQLIPLNVRNRAYMDVAIAIGKSQTISSPLIVAQMT